MFCKWYGKKCKDHNMVKPDQAQKDEELKRKREKTKLV